MKSVIAFVLSAIIFVLADISAEAYFLTFDDVLTPGSGETGDLPVNYGGYTWDTNMPDYSGGTGGRFMVSDENSYAHPYDTSKYAFNAYGGYDMGFTSPTPIYSINGWFSLTSQSDDEFVPQPNPSPIRIAGYLGDTLVGSSYWTNLKLTGEGSLISANFSGADRIVFEMAGSGWYAMDNLTVKHTPLPEPTSVILLGFGLMGLAWGRKKLQGTESRCSRSGMDIHL